MGKAAYICASMIVGLSMMVSGLCGWCVAMQYQVMALLLFIGVSIFWVSFFNWAWLNRER